LFFLADLFFHKLFLLGHYVTVCFRYKAWQGWSMQDILRH